MLTYVNYLLVVNISTFTVSIIINLIKDATHGIKRQQNAFEDGTKQKVCLIEGAYFNYFTVKR